MLVKITKTAALAFGGASLAALAFAATVAAAGPTGNGGTQGQAPGRGQTQAHGASQAGVGDVAPTILGLSQAETRALRQSGLSLAQIAEKRAVDPTRLIEAFAARWSARIDDRVSTGALTAADATALKDQLTVRAKDMVYRTTLGGMRGAAVGAGPDAAGTPGAGNGMGAGNGRWRGGNGAGTGAGNGACDGTGPGAAAQP
jgi:hypothetical protein